ncbi:FmdB family zinc ribbon protein [Haloglycomyces albus]|uniref:FmdB family zinc ribbon protein n=1 Tax=Haloglycomyces albus TaxID=526067 RepID=UPI00046D594D|nr:FmdB family zinc ribbon protein [Haloglycomyces albus]
MPVYEYRCGDCGYEFDQRQSFSEARLTDCPSCGQEKSLKKLFGSVGVSFKGSGFYRNDSRSTNSSKIGSDSSQKDGKKKEDSGGESKSSDAAKSETKSSSSSKSSDKAA